MINDHDLFTVVLLVTLSCQEFEGGGRHKIITSKLQSTVIGDRNSDGGNKIRIFNS